MNAKTAAADTTLYRIDLRYCGDATPDPRAQLAEHAASADESAALRTKLDAMDSRSPHGAWTQRVLGMIAKSPGIRAGDLAARIGLGHGHVQATRPQTEDARAHRKSGSGLPVVDEGQLVREGARLNNTTVSPNA